MTSKERRHANQTYCTEATTACNMARSIGAIIQASPNGDFRRACLHVIRQWHEAAAAALPPSPPPPMRRRSERVRDRVTGSTRQPTAPAPAAADAIPTEMRPNHRLHINMAIRQDVLRRLHAHLIGK